MPARIAGPRHHAGLIARYLPGFLTAFWDASFSGIRVRTSLAALSVRTERFLLTRNSISLALTTGPKRSVNE